MVTSRFGAHAKLSSGICMLKLLLHHLSRFGAHAKLSSGLQLEKAHAATGRFGAHAKLSSGPV